MTTANFVRDRFTWLAYGMLGFFAFMQSAPGQLMPFLRDELDLSYTVGGLHMSALAFGMVLAGLGGEGLAVRIGRWAMFWIGGGGLVVGAMLLILGQHPAITIAGTLVMGTIGGLLLTTIQATLSDQHGDQRAYALTEANVAASLCAMFAPLLIGGFESIDVGWRGALVVAAILWGVAALRFARTVTVPPLSNAHTQHGGEASSTIPLSKRFWVYWGALVLGTSVEWCVVFWGADFLDTVVALRTEMASLLMTVFFAAMVFARLAASRLTRHQPAETLLLYAVAITLVGLPLFWLSPVAVLNVVGLFIAGLGIANLFPLALAAATNAAPERADAASARILIGTGTAILSMPLLLGSLADVVGLKTAFGMAAVLLLLTATFAFSANRLINQRT